MSDIILRDEVEADHKKEHEVLLEAVNILGEIILEYDRMIKELIDHVNVISDFFNKITTSENPPNDN